MNTVASWANELELREQRKTGLRLQAARKNVARRIGVSPGTLENLKRGRSKGLRDWVIQRIHKGIMDELEQEARRLKHELEILRQCGLDAREDEVSKVESLIAQARVLLAGRQK